MTSKKAMNIYLCSEDAVRRDVRRGEFYQYDVALLDYDGLMCRRTINDLKAIWANRCKMLERRLRLMERFGYEDKDAFATDVEVLRRMWLGIRHREYIDIDFDLEYFANLA